MPFTIHEEKTYPFALGKLKTAARGAIGGLEGHIIKEEENGDVLTAKFPKTVLNHLLGDRTQMELRFEAISDTESKISITIFPLNAVEQKLMFGARKGVSRTVLTWFIAHTEHRLK